MQISKREINALHELALRKNMALNMFRPLSHQEDIFTNQYSQYLIRGGNRSSCKGTLLWKCEDGKGRGARPTNYSLCKVEDIQVGDKVAAFKEGKRSEIRSATVTSIDRYPESTFKLTTKRGYELEGTHDHPVWACPPLPGRYHNSVDPDFKKGQWVLMRDLKPGWFVRMSFGCWIGWKGEQDDDAYYYGLMEGDGSVQAKHSTSMQLAGHKDETLTDWVRGYVLSKQPDLNVQTRQSSENGVDTYWCSRELKDDYLAYEIPGTPEGMSSYLRGLFDADGCVTQDGKIVLIQKDTERVRLVQNLLLMFGIKCSAHLQKASPEHKRPNPTWRLQIGGCSVRRYAESIGFNEESKKEKLRATVAQRRKPGANKMWWDRVQSCDHTKEVKEIIAIATSLETYISNGVVSHNSGKSTCASVLFAAIATQQPITLEDGTEVQCRRPWQMDKKLEMWVIGYDWVHVGKTLYRLLFQNDMFKIIQDKESGVFRAWRPWEPEDEAREKETKGSPPLIPARYIDPSSWAWENKKLKQFRKVDIWDPVTHKPLAEITAFPSTAEPKAGDPVDTIWIDERIEWAEHYDEWKARLTDRQGNIFWSSWPSIENDALRDLTEQAELQKDDPDAEVGEIVLPFSSNRAMPEKVRAKRQKQYASDEERLARDLGEYVTTLTRMYPKFDEYTHQVHLSEEDPISLAFSQNDNQPPSDWTRELILDPGTGHPGILLCTIPPPSFGEFYIVYDEINVKQADSDRLAKLVNEKLKGHRLHRMIIDNRAARQTPMGFRLTVGENYANSFKRFGVKDENDRVNFIPGSDNVSARIAKLQDWMMPKQNGRPKFRVLRERCPELCRQLRNYLKKSVGKHVEEYKPKDRQTIDLAVAAEYWAASSPRYSKPRVKPISFEDWADSFFEDKRKRRKQLFDQSSEIIIGPKYSFE